MKQPIKLSIIVVSYNTKELTINCLDSIFDSLAQSPLNFEIIIIDNNSLDGSARAIENKFPQVRILKNTKNTGFGKANNQGVNAAQGDVVLFLNSDTVVLDRSIEKLYNFYAGCLSNTIVGGKLFNFDKTAQSSCGPAYTLPVIFTALFLKGDYLQLTRYSPDKIKQVDWVMGACLMLSKRAFIDMGGFDESIFMYMDEIDLQYRAKQKGYTIYFYPDAHFIHLGSGSSKGRETPILNVFRGFMYFYKKHYSGWREVILRIMIILKSVLGFGLFTILNKISDRNMYLKALKLSIS